MGQTTLVRPPTRQDFDGIVTLLELRHSEFGMGRFSIEKTRRMVAAAVDRTLSIIAAVIGDEGSPEATIGLSLAEWFDTDERHLEAVWDYVHPDFRTTEHSRKLDQYAQMAANTLGVDLIVGGAIRTGHEGKVRAYCKNFRPIGAFFMYDGPEMARGTKKQREARASHLMQAFSGAAG